jgi:hypothetical protein
MARGHAGGDSAGGGAAHAGGVGAISRASRRRRGDRGRRQHARVWLGQHGPPVCFRTRPEPLEYRPVPRRIVERPGRGGRRPVGRRRGRRRRGGIDSLSLRILRAHRAEADLRALDDGRPSRAADHDDRLRADVPRRRRLPAARRRSVRRGLGERRARTTPDRGRSRRALGRLRPRGGRRLPGSRGSAGRGHGRGGRGG